MSADERAEALLDRAEAALDGGDPEAALALCEQALLLLPGHAGASFVRGDALRMLGQLPEAADAYRTAALAQPEHSASWSALALTCFELLRMDEAGRAAARAIRENPHDADAWWVRSLVHEWYDHPDGAERCARHAAWLSPDAHPLPPELSDDEIEALVTDALLYMPEAVRDYLVDVAIILEEIPDEEACLHYDPPASPLDLLGYFSGASLVERSLEDPWTQLPGTIVLYRRNLARRSSSREELVEQLRITLFHEVGHFLGLDEDDLEDRGLE